jgi:cold shock CspA family protein
MRRGSRVFDAFERADRGIVPNPPDAPKISSRPQNGRGKGIKGLTYQPSHLRRFSQEISSKISKGNIAMRRNGVVLRFGARGFGFLTDVETRRTYYVHIHDVENFIQLQAGDRVTFEIAPPWPGSKQSYERAAKVCLVSTPDLVADPQVRP